MGIIEACIVFHSFRVRIDIVSLDVIKFDYWLICYFSSSFGGNVVFCNPHSSYIIDQ